MIYDEFINNEDLIRSFVRSLEVVEEACKNIPDVIRYEYLEFDWKGFAGMRDKLIHHYWGIDYQLLWDAIQQAVPMNKEWVDVIIEQEVAKLSNE